ncbi:hypothetical protein RhiirA1_403251 [Rhizophagus irregularis]|uniref:Uncharacterized protein n=1 Tax=Rhizophagus irregularis TaxID=588596 RepID=A0A2N0QVB3_9GLOM|nr:hypothetical protein RhiirA1_403251 [Rhizophagus irregularis]
MQEAIASHNAENYSIHEYDNFFWNFRIMNIYDAAALDHMHLQEIGLFPYMLDYTREKLKHEENINELCIEGMEHLIACLDIYLDDISNASANEEIYLKIYANGTLSNGEIVYAISKFHGYARFSDVAIAMGDTDYLTDGGLCYGKASINVN